MTKKALTGVARVRYLIRVVNKCQSEKKQVSPKVFALVQFSLFQICGSSLELLL